MSVIEDLEKKVQSLGDQLSAAKASLLKARLEACPVKEGSIVLSKKYGECRVTELDFTFTYRAPWLKGCPKNKDGDFGKREVNLYGDWKMVQP